MNTRISTGMPAVDDMLDGGLVRGSVTIIGGFPGSGKTTLGVQMVCAHGRGRLYSSEQSQAALLTIAKRVAPKVGRAQLHECRDLEKLNDAEFANLDLVVIDTINSFDMLPHRVVEWAADRAKKGKFAVVLMAQLNRDGELRGGPRAEYAADTLLGLDCGSDERLLFITGKHRHGKVDVEPVRMKMTTAGLIVKEDAVSTALQ